MKKHENEIKGENVRDEWNGSCVPGTAIPFAMFVLWDAAVLGSVSAEDAASAAAAVAAGGAVIDPLAALRDTSTTAAALVQGFSFFAISTSFLGFVLGGVDTSSPRTRSVIHST